jgi:hypothetical protein
VLSYAQNKPKTTPTAAAIQIKSIEKKYKKPNEIEL